MSSLLQRGQFINEPGRYYIDALADPPDGAVEALEWSKEQAQEVGDTDTSNNRPWEYRHTDYYKDQYDTQQMSHQQFAS